MRAVIGIAEEAEARENEEHMREGGEIFWLRERAAEGGFSWLFDRDFKAFEAEQNLTGEGHSQV